MRDLTHDEGIFESTVESEQNVMEEHFPSFIFF